ncbi:MAG TPA: hypothetical protein VJR92_13040 [Gemmatimonadaceae bacterium]|nr:hypothetical protein [Gemmatimonadaceae bacterium]
MSFRAAHSAIAFALCATACRSVPPRLGTTAAQANAAVDGVFGGVSTRFDRAYREPKVRKARSLISRAVLTPSRVFNDTAAWLWSPGPDVRVLTFRGISEPGRYRFAANGDVSMPARPGEGRHDTRLRRIDDDEFEWTMAADYGIGATTPDAIATLPVAWIAAGERDDAGNVRNEIHSAFPRSTREWGRLFAVNDLRSSRDASGAWRQRRVITIAPSRLTQSYPAFGKWVKEHISPMRLRVRLRDGARTWFDFALRNDTITIDTRSLDGRLRPLEGGDAAMPDTVTIETDFSTKVAIFRAGFRELRGDFITVREPGRRGWSLRWTREPEWDLPLFTERMIRTPLRRPFQGTGVQFRIVASRDSAAPQTYLSRRVVAPVQESAIVRFIARLANAGVGDYVDGADSDTNKWISAAFAALRDDTRAILVAMESETPSR